MLEDEKDQEKLDRLQKMVDGIKFDIKVLIGFIFVCLIVLTIWSLFF